MQVRAAASLKLLLWLLAPGVAAQAAVSIDQLLASAPQRIYAERWRGAVLQGTAARAWMNEAVGLPTAIADGELIRMYFVGLQKTDNAYVSRARIGLAESTDGLSFQIANGGNPVFAEGPAGSFDSHSVSHPCVMRVNGEYWMYYAAADGTQGANGVRIERLGLARSKDGLTWVRSSKPVLDLGAAGAVDSSQVASPSVLRTSRGFEMWYGAYDGAHRIAYATSADGIAWTRHGAVSGLRGADAGELGPSVYHDGTRYLMFYNSVDRDAAEWRLYAATSTDGRAWTPAFRGEAVVPPAPPATFAEAGRGRNNAVHLSELIARPDGLLAYYTGEDLTTTQRIGAIRFQIR